MHSSQTFKCAFLIRSLGTGGAERQLVELARGLRSGGIHVTVITFYPGGAFQPVLQRSGVNVVSVNKKGRWDIVGFLRRLVKVIRAERPDVLYSFLSSANLVAALTRYCAPRRLVVWSVRESSLDLSSYDWLVRVGQVGLPVTFRLRAGGEATQGLVEEVWGQTIAFFENGPLGGAVEVSVGDIVPDSLACWVGGEIGWLDWREPIPAARAGERYVRQ